MNIKLNQRGDFHRIFEGINDRGRPLSNSDKFKNTYLVYLENDNHLMFEKEWFELLERVYSIEKKFEKHVFNYLPLSNGIDTTKHYQTIKKEIDEKKLDKRLPMLKNHLSSIKRQVSGIECVYKSDKDLSDLYFSKKPDKQTHDKAKLLTLLSRLTWNAYDQFGIIFYALIKEHKFSDDKISFSKTMDELSYAIKYLLILMFSGEKSQTVRPKLVNLINNQIKRGKSLKTELESVQKNFVDDQLKVKDLYEISNRDNSILVLSIIQAVFNEQYLKEHYATFLNETMSVEHFAPAKWKESWNELENETYIDLNEKFSKDLSGKNLDDSYLIQHHKNEDDPQKNGPKNDNFILEHIGNKLWLKQPTNS